MAFQDSNPEPRTVILTRDSEHGFGFVAGSERPVIVRFVRSGGPSVNRLMPGDLILKINGEDVRQASHERVVNLIRKSGDLVSLTVVTVTLSPTNPDPMNSGSPMTGTTPMMSQPGRQYASTLPRKFQGRSMVQPPPPPKRDPNTTLSVGRARAKSMVANLAALGEWLRPPKVILNCCILNSLFFSRNIFCLILIGARWGLKMFS